MQTFYLPRQAGVRIKDHIAERVRGPYSGLFAGGSRGGLGRDGPRGLLRPRRVARRERGRGTLGV